ncbi:MAG: hypothetical protein ACE5FU_03155, partial [Nitrospinota bacterium]
MNLQKSLGVRTTSSPAEKRSDVIKFLNLKLASLAAPHYAKGEYAALGIAEDLVNNFSEKNRLLSDTLSPPDRRIQEFLDGYLEGAASTRVKIPSFTLTLDRHGLARELSIPPDRQEFLTDIVQSYRVEQGVLHNPENDRRTTEGVFHIAEGGLPVPFDKKAVPKEVFAALLQRACTPDEKLLELPFTSTQQEKARLFVSLLIRPLVCPSVPGFTDPKRMEIRVFSPGSLVCNLDFIESVFGNAGNPHLPENDAVLDIDGWTGHTGCIILAPQLTRYTKRELGLPHKKEASENALKSGMYWSKPEELYNDGKSFKICCRDKKGVIVTLIADNYFGYCKKEVKTQISYSANLFGLCEEEHAGGALAFSQYNEGDYFVHDANVYNQGHNFKTLKKLLKGKISVKPQGYAVDKNYRDIIYLPEDATISLKTQEATWKTNGQVRKLRVTPGKTYFHPSGSKTRLKKHEKAPTWRLVTTSAEGTLCHKPSTVSGGGKSEISKSIVDQMYWGPSFVADFKEDMDLVAEIINYDYSKRLVTPPRQANPSRSILNPSRSIGSVIKLLTPSSLFTDEYNSWVQKFPGRIKALAFFVKRFYKEEWGEDWRRHFSVDIINGEPGHELKFDDRKLVGGYLRIGHQEDGSWRTFKVRQDFIPSQKLQWEDDISASITLGANWTKNSDPQYKNLSVKIVENCEYRFFQRPDDAKIRGYDKQAEADISTGGNFLSNFEPLKVKDAKDLYELAVSFDKYTSPMQQLIKKVAGEKSCRYFVSSAHPRIVNGRPTKNPRYLQLRPGLADDRKLYIARTGIRLQRKIPADEPVYTPVNAVLPGRRNNPAEKGIRSLAVYNPIHFQELPELFMDFICSLTGKSPSTTGAGSEGALTKGPFNSLLPTVDLNNALLSFILTGYQGFSTASGYIGHKFQVNHDISLLIPELWCRLNESERDPEFLKKKGLLEKLEDFEHKGKKVLASRLGYRITGEFAAYFMGRIFDNPGAVFDEEMLKPELQGLDEFVDGIDNIVEAQRRIGMEYISSAAIETAIPPLKALVYLMVYGEFEGNTISSPRIRRLFTRKYVLRT